MFPLGPDREIAPGASALDAMHKMNEADSGRLVVVDGGKWWDLSPAPGRAYRADEGAARGRCQTFGGRRDVSKYQGYEYQGLPSEIILRPVDGKSYGRTL